MADFNLDRIRFRWKSTWTADTAYVKDDIVYYKGKAYVCLIGHTSNSAALTTDLNDASPKWVLMLDGFVWRGDWSTETYYTPGDTVKFDGYVYRCVTAHTSTNLVNFRLPADIANWTLVATTYDWTNTWMPGTYYDLGDVVKYNGIVYICSAKHLSAATNALGLEDDQGSWTVVTVSDSWQTDWATETRYRVHDIVRYGGIVYRCIEGHTSAATATLGLENDQSKWEISVEGIEYKTDWEINTRYKKNDVVKYGGALWKANTGHTSTATLRADESNWDIWVPGIEFERQWVQFNEYQRGDLVLYGGYTYIALQNNQGTVPSVNGIVQDTGDWELVTKGYRHLGDWIVSTDYRTGDVVRYNGYLYVAVDDSVNTKPDSDDTKWSVIVEGRKWKREWQDNVEYSKGDVVTYAGTAYVCILEHLGTESDNRPDLDIENTNENYWSVLIQGSTTNVLTTQGDLRTHDGAETLRLPAGGRGAVLKVANNVPTYEEFDASPNVFYVSNDGIDDPNTGRTTSAPFKTVQYGLQHITNNLGINKINVQKYNDDVGTIFTMLAEALLRYWSSSNANAPTLDSALGTTNPRTGDPYGDISGDGSITSTDSIREFYGSLGVAQLTEEQALRYNELIDYLNSRADDFVGETIAKNNYAIGSVPVIVATYPNTTLFVKTGIYEEELPLRIPRNCAVVGDELRSTVIMPQAGDELSDMFYVNNGSGIRNMTLQGLAGELPTAFNEFGTRLPTGGAFVSLDPGTGPNDESVWIIGKSPYVQNVTTFGTGCIGMKIDGTLHTGGTKSVVANDFTQVLDDGIGYWANEAGRSELVSVFTYFCYIGYYATNGGILRGTNGNNSYGTFGSRAEGYSLFETPITAQIDNQRNEAQVEIVHTNSNEVVAFGYSHAGQEYTTATPVVTGTGVNFNGTYTDFRDNAISQIRIIDPADSSTPGGLNYQYLLNTSQGGDDGNILLAGADTNEDPNLYIGQRITITAGKGIGQYGYISAYNPLTKAAVISKEYNDTNGWENLDPGRPIETVLDSTTRYSLEPRVIIDDPGFNLSNATITWPDGNFITSGLKDIKFVNGTYIAVNGNGDTGISTDGESFAPSTNVVVSGNAPGGFYTSDTSSTAAYFMDRFTGVIRKYIEATDSWSTISISGVSGNAEHIHVRNDNDTIVVADGNNLLKSNGDGSTQSSTALSGPFLTPGGLPCGVAYGNGIWVYVHSNGNVALSTDNASTWAEITNALPNINWVHMTFGNGRFVVVGDDGGTVRASYSFNGADWYDDDTNLGLMPNTSLRRIVYNNGEFLAFAQGSGTQTVAKSKDGWAWQWFNEDSTVYTITSSDGVTSAAGPDLWVVASGSSTVNKLSTGAGAVARVHVDGSRISNFVIYDPGANYTTTPGVLVYDNQNTIDVLQDTRMASGVLSQPEFTNRGDSFLTATAEITGDGFADIFQVGKTVRFKNVSFVPGPGANVVFDSIDDVIYRLTKINSQSGTSPNIDVEFEISPPLTNQNSPAHNENIIMRELYSQIRLTGHDFLDIGSGNVNSTRYPDLYLEGVDSLNEPQPFNEVTQFDGGRVFYTSTDQDGNFRVGELFAVEQATGVVSINADFFELSGLEELSLGAIQLGGTAVVIREFSKEQTFAANSNNIVPTQRAIAEYLSSRISGGGADAVTNTLIAGQIRTTANTISNDAGLAINIPVPVNFTGGIDGMALAQMFFTSGK